MKHKLLIRSASTLLATAFVLSAWATYPGSGTMAASKRLSASASKEVAGTGLRCTEGCNDPTVCDGVPALQRWVKTQGNPMKYCKTVPEEHSCLTDGELPCLKFWDCSDDDCTDCVRATSKDQMKLHCTS